MRFKITMVLGCFLLSGCGTPFLDRFGPWELMGEDRYRCDINPLLDGCPYGER